MCGLSEVSGAHHVASNNPSYLQKRQCGHKGCRSNYGNIITPYLAFDASNRVSDCQSQIWRRSSGPARQRAAGHSCTVFDSISHLLASNDVNLFTLRPTHRSPPARHADYFVSCTFFCQFPFLCCAATVGLSFKFLLIILVPFYIITRSTDPPTAIINVGEV